MKFHDAVVRLGQENQLCHTAILIGQSSELGDSS